MRQKCALTFAIVVALLGLNAALSAPAATRPIFLICFFHPHCIEMLQSICQFLKKTAPFASLELVKVRETAGGKYRQQRVEESGAGAMGRWSRRSVPPRDSGWASSEPNMFGSITITAEARPSGRLPRCCASLSVSFFPSSSTLDWLVQFCLAYHSYRPKPTFSLSFV